MKVPFKKIAWKRFIPLLILIFLMSIGYASGIYKYISLKNVKEQHAEIKNFVQIHSVSAPLLFILLYVVVTGLSFPGAAILSLIGGFLFPIPFSTLYVIIGATFGASIIFFITRTAFGEILRNRGSPFFKKMEQGFQKNAWSYLLFLRFVPLFPFWLVNVAAAFFQVRFSTFLWTTCVGIAPGSYAYTQAGSGIETILKSKDPLSLPAIFNTQVIIALLVLGTIILVSFILKKILLKKGGE